MTILSRCEASGRWHDRRDLHATRPFDCALRVASSRGWRL